MATPKIDAGRPGDVRLAGPADADGVASLAAQLALSFPFDREKFLAHYPVLLATDHATLLVATEGPAPGPAEAPAEGPAAAPAATPGPLGYLLGFQHLTFYANGPVAWVEEIVVRDGTRGRGIGRALMSAFEQRAAARGCALVALATRRAAPFYQALGYEDSAIYFRKLAGSRPRS